MADGFLGRWSQRKQAVREGKPLDEPVLPKPTPAAAPVLAQASPPAAAIQPEMDVQGATAPQEPAPPSLEDVKNLTAESDFKPFVGRDVAPEVRNAAMKKLFADPHYNVMDRLDIYIDDYSKPDPLPESMLRQMASAKFLKLFEEEQDDPSQPGVRDDANTPHVQSVAESTSLPKVDAGQTSVNTPPITGEDHDNTDLRLQPNHAAGPQEPGRSAE